MDSCVYEKPDAIFLLTHHIYNVDETWDTSPSLTDTQAEITHPIQQTAFDKCSRQWVLQSADKQMNNLLLRHLTWWYITIGDILSLVIYIPASWDLLFWSWTQTTYWTCWTLKLIFSSHSRGTNSTTGTKWNHDKRQTIIHPSIE